MSDTYAKIQNGIIVDLILADPSDQFDPQYIWVDVTSSNPIPQIGWITSDNATFTQPGLPNDAYGNRVVFSTDGTTDTYVVGGITTYTFPAGTPQGHAYVQFAIMQNLFLFKVAMEDFVDSKYDLSTRFNFNAMYILANLGGLSNRATYILQLLTWAQSVVAYAAVYAATIKAMTNPATIASTRWDFTQVSLPDPLVNPMVAIGIPN